MYQKTYGWGPLDTTFTLNGITSLYNPVTEHNYGKKMNLSLCLTKNHTMKTYSGSGGIHPRILDLGTRWGWVVSFTPWPLYLRWNSSHYTLDRRLGGPQSL